MGARNGSPPAGSASAQLIDDLGARAGPADIPGGRRAVAAGIAGVGLAGGRPSAASGPAPARRAAERSGERRRAHVGDALTQVGRPAGSRLRDLPEQRLAEHPPQQLDRVHHLGSPSGLPPARRDPAPATATAPRAGARARRPSERPRSAPRTAPAPLRRASAAAGSRACRAGASPRARPPSPRRPGRAATAGPPARSSASARGAGVGCEPRCSVTPEEYQHPPTHVCSTATAPVDAARLPTRDGRRPYRRGAVRAACWRRRGSCGDGPTAGRGERRSWTSRTRPRSTRRPKRSPRSRGRTC